jgi:hypothetical protein
MVSADCFHVPNTQLTCQLIHITMALSAFLQVYLHLQCQHVVSKCERGEKVMSKHSGLGLSCMVILRSNHRWDGQDFLSGDGLVVIAVGRLFEQKDE